MKRKRKRKPEKFRLRWKTKIKTGYRWEPSGWATNSRKEALKLAEEYRDDPEAQIWDYENKEVV